MANCIIKENGYKIIISDDLSGAVLANGLVGVIFDIPEKYKKYRLISNDIDFNWGTAGLKKDTLLITYKENELVTFENANCQLVVDYLNKFEKLSKKEVEELILEVQEKTKNELEIIIAELQEKKEKLFKQVSILNLLAKKTEEIKALLEKLD